MSQGTRCGPHYRYLHERTNLSALVTALAARYAGRSSSRSHRAGRDGSGKVVRRPRVAIVAQCTCDGDVGTDSEADPVQVGDQLQVAISPRAPDATKVVELVEVAGWVQQHQVDPLELIRWVKEQVDGRTADAYEQVRQFLGLKVSLIHLLAALHLAPTGRPVPPLYMRAGRIPAHVLLVCVRIDYL